MSLPRTTSREAPLKVSRGSLARRRARKEGPERSREAEPQRQARASRRGVISSRVTATRHGTPTEGLWLGSKLRYSLSEPQGQSDRREGPTRRMRFARDPNTLAPLQRLTPDKTGAQPPWEISPHLRSGAEGIINGVVEFLNVLAEIPSTLFEVAKEFVSNMLSPDWVTPEGVRISNQKAFDPKSLGLSLAVAKGKIQGTPPPRNKGGSRPDLDPPKPVPDPKEIEALQGIRNLIARLRDTFNNDQYAKDFLQQLDKIERALAQGFSAFYLIGLLEAALPLAEPNRYYSTKLKLPSARESAGTPLASKSPTAPNKQRPVPVAAQARTVIPTTEEVVLTQAETKKVARIQALVDACLEVNEGSLKPATVKALRAIPGKTIQRRQRDLDQAASFVTGTIRTVNGFNHLLTTKLEALRDELRTP